MALRFTLQRSAKRLETATYALNPWSTASNSWKERINNPSRAPWQHDPTEARPDPYPHKLFENETYPRKGMGIVEYATMHWDMGRRTHSWMYRLQANVTFIACVAWALWCTKTFISAGKTPAHTHDEHHRQELVNAVVQA